LSVYGGDIVDEKGKKGEKKKKKSAITNINLIIFTIL
jgi:hypothetical protein